MKLKTTAFIFFIGLLPVTAVADKCVPVNNFIILGKQAEKCVSKIKLGKNSVNDVLSNYGFCTNVRDTRGDVEKGVKKLSVATINSCAKKDLPAYTAAATAIHRMYQIELRLQ